MAAAGVVVFSLSREISGPFDSARGIEHHLGKTPVQILTAQPEKIGVFIIIDGKLPAVNLACTLIGDLYRHNVRNELKKFLIHGKNLPSLS